MTERREVEPGEREILVHSLKGGSDRVFRNYFAADLATEDGLVCLSLVEQGLMVRRPNADADGLVYFHVTQAGAEAVGLHLPIIPMSRFCARMSLEDLGILKQAGPREHRSLHAAQAIFENIAEIEQLAGAQGQLYQDDRVERYEWCRLVAMVIEVYFQPTTSE